MDDATTLYWPSYREPKSGREERPRSSTVDWRDALRRKLVIRNEAIRECISECFGTFLLLVRMCRCRLSRSRRTCALWQDEVDWFLEYDWFGCRKMYPDYFCQGEQLVSIHPPKTIRPSVRPYVRTYVSMYAWTASINRLHKLLLLGLLLKPDRQVSPPPRFEVSLATKIYKRFIPGTNWGRVLPPDCARAI